MASPHPRPPLPPRRERGSRVRGGGSYAIAPRPRRAGRLRAGPGALRRARRRYRRGPGRGWPRSPSACTAGRATTWAASRAPAASWRGGIAATGNYPGKARTADELRSDLDKAYSLIPGTHRLNLHAIYAETGGKQVERNELRPEHFAALGRLGQGERPRPGLQPHLLLAPHGRRRLHPGQPRRGHPPVLGRALHRLPQDRRVTSASALGTPCVTNIWIPDGYKDTPVDRKAPRELLRRARSTPILAEKIDPRYNLDAVEGKLFGLGSESYVVGSHEFYLGYAVSRQDPADASTPATSTPPRPSPTRSRRPCCSCPSCCCTSAAGVRWDSDHVVILNDDLQAIAQEIVRGGFLGRVHIGLDYFDASINRVAAWVIGTRNTLRALLMALLEPADQLRELEAGRRLHRPPGAAGRAQEPALRRRLGLLLPAPGRAGRHGLLGEFAATSATCWPHAADWGCAKPAVAHWRLCRQCPTSNRGRRSRPNPHREGDQPSTTDLPARHLWLGRRLRRHARPAGAGSSTAPTCSAPTSASPTPAAATPRRS